MWKTVVVEGMERTRRTVNQIAYTPTQNFSKLPLLQRCSLLPLLYLSSSLYKLALSLRHHLYNLGVFRKRRLPVPVISVGNLTWGGNGKTPMVEFIALLFAKAGISPLVLTRGYAGGDEAKMLQRHLSATSTKIGVGANRFATAASFLQPQSCLDPRWNTRTNINQDVKSTSSSNKIGVVVLDDGMQHWSLFRDVDIVMVNGMKPWGNNQLIPLGPLREPLTALKRADVVVIHHADMLGPLYVDRLDFSDHHLFQGKDIEMIKARLEKLQDEYSSKPVVVVTEKDYDRDPDVLKDFCPFEVLVLCSQLQIMPSMEYTQDCFRTLMKQLLERKFPSSVPFRI